MRRFVLASSGVIFYGYYAQGYLWVIMGELILIYILTVKYAYKKITIALVVTVSILAYFKYRVFLYEAFSQIAYFIQENLSMSIKEITIPLAISFFTFEFVHFIVDIRRRKIKTFSLLELMSFVFFFPTMIAGPIKRFPEFNPQVDSAKLRPENMLVGAQRILTGIFKKKVLADTLTAIVGDMLTSKTVLLTATPARLWIALFSYSWQIYFDFSGYSDIAIGSARLFGITIPENFNRPYLSTNVAAFWKRWHISLYRWLIEYIFIPLGGSKKNLARTSVNVIVTLVISGLWHGAAWNFLIWGFYHGILLVVYRIYKLLFSPIYVHKFNLLIQTASLLVTFTIISIGWVFFISPLPVAFLVLQKLFSIKI